VSNPPSAPVGLPPAPLFPLGRVVSTPGAVTLLETLAGESPGGGRAVAATLLRRHARGDWGDLDPEDRAANNRAVTDGDRILSSYPTAAGKLWIITEWDRSATTMLLPSEY
jgi:hypothetical protein